MGGLYMSDILTTVIIPIMSAVVGAVIGVLFQRLVYPDNSNNNVNPDWNFGGNTVILDYKNIHIWQNRIIKEKEIIKEKKIIENKKKVQSSNEDILLVIIGLLLIGVALIWGYLKFQKEIFYILLICAVFIISMCLSAVYVVTRKNIMMDSRFKSIIIWIIVSTIFIPIEVYLLMNPIYFKSVNKELILENMNNNGILSILTNQGIDVFGFLLYQVIGVVITIFFILHLLCGNIHIWAMINLRLNSKMESFWRFIYRMTNIFTCSRLYFIGFSVFLLFLSFIFSSGVLANLIAKNSYVSNL